MSQGCFLSILKGNYYRFEILNSTLTSSLKMYKTLICNLSLLSVIISRHYAKYVRLPRNKLRHKKAQPRNNRFRPNIQYNDAV